MRDGEESDDAFREPIPGTDCGCYVAFEQMAVTASESDISILRELHETHGHETIQAAIEKAAEQQERDGDRKGAAYVRTICQAMARRPQEQGSAAFERAWAEAE